MLRARPLVLALALAGLSCSGSSLANKLALGGDCAGQNDSCQSGLCYSIDSGSSVCTKSCSSLADCPAKWICDSVTGVTNGKICLPTGLGGRCASDADCSAGYLCDTDANRCYIPVSRELCSPCTSSKQCPTGGACTTVVATGEMYCTVGCATGPCPSGFSCQTVGEAPTRQCVPDNPQRSCHAGKSLCSPCRSDSECGGEGDVCVRNVASGEQFCGKKCAKDADCPASFNCLDLSGDGRGPTQCVPDAQTCAGYCDSTDPAAVQRECGLGASCDLSARRCTPATDGRECAACTDDDGCPSTDGGTRCLVNDCPDCPFKGEKFCATSCDDGHGAADPSKCGAGFFCAGLGSGGTSGPWHCVPTSGTCRSGAGALGDDCTAQGAAECLSGVCLQFTGESVCSAPCHTDPDCGDGRFKCCALADGGASFDCGQAPGTAGGVCSPRGGGFGADCGPGEPPCFDGACLDLGTAALCTKACTADADCPKSFACREARQPNGDGTFTPKKVCFPDGGGTLGADCTFGPAACQSGLCLKKLSGNVCTKPCTVDADCGADFTCLSSTVVGGADSGTTGNYCVPKVL